MQDRFIGEVECLSGRRVTLFMSNSHVGPDLEIELFVLAPGARPRLAHAEARLRRARPGLTRRRAVCVAGLRCPRAP